MKVGQGVVVSGAPHLENDIEEFYTGVTYQYVPLSLTAYGRGRRNRLLA